MKREQVIQMCAQMLGVEEDAVPDDAIQACLKFKIMQDRIDPIGIPVVHYAGLLTSMGFGDVEQEKPDIEPETESEPEPCSPPVPEHGTGDDIHPITVYEGQGVTVVREGREDKEGFFVKIRENGDVGVRFGSKGCTYYPESQILYDE